MTFVLNGGPGASSAWLHLGALGPWRLPMAGDAALPSAPPDLLPNAETWLDFTDLVFVDPVGTGYSAFARPGDELRRRLWSVEGDIQSLAEIIRRWLENAGRVGSPKFLVSESYGGFRGPRLARALQVDQGIGLLGLMLISPVLDFAGRALPFDPLTQATRLPSMVAAARAVSGAVVTRESLAEVERYALGEYLTDLLRGERDAEAVARRSERVAALTGLDSALVRQRRGRLETGEFLRELHRGRHRVGSAYDATETRPDPFPAALVSRHPDPVLDGLMAPLASAMLELYGKRLDWRPDGRRYELLNRSVNREWGWGGALSPPEAIGSLRTALAFDTRLRVVVAHGLFLPRHPLHGHKGHPRPDAINRGRRSDPVPCLSGWAHVLRARRLARRIARGGTNDARATLTQPASRSGPPCRMSSYGFRPSQSGSPEGRLVEAAELARMKRAQLTTKDAEGYQADGEVLPHSALVERARGAR
ncbi:hypothetical protein Q7A36_37785 [Paracraurococcus sp. LOR1-02]|uniref:Peptidase S10 n=1 Tax=Paracraurococcus lichenis TaxID=3064888 RepID=A0ABT9EDR5_9PROT|nr:hypothetical protein [Paracraurococcus sp. LOR1-02]MDO9714113.1 hypothetical protein [Paracraurococcus sp. LOR1-02]